MGGVGLGLITLAFVVVARPLRAPSGPPLSLTPVPSVAAEAPEPEREAEPAREPEPNLEAKAEAVANPDAGPAVAAALVASPRGVEAEAEGSASAPTAAASDSIAVAPPPSPSAAPARPSQAQLESAIRATPIVMFSTDWCAVCQRARAFMDANGLRYVERDIDRDANARDQLKRLTGKASIPTIEVDGQLLPPGFSEQAVMAAVAASAKQRLGVEAIDVRAGN